MKHSAFLLAHLLSASAWAATCYYPNGNSSIHSNSVPCSTLNGEVSMCCGETDECLTNGLCKVAATPGVANSKASYWRDTCSNSDWTNPRCLNRCTSKTEGLDTGNTRMTPCNSSDYSETWCCGTDTSCCGTDSAVHLPANIYETSSPTSTASSASSSSTSTSTGSASQGSSSSSSSSSSSGLSSGAKAGVGAGVGVGGCLTIALLVLSFLLYRRRRDNNAADGPAADPALHAPLGPVSMQQAHELEVGQVHEKPANIHDAKFELPAEPSSSQATR